jgi:transcriptional regulator with XRE-family HTH domain
MGGRRSQAEIEADEESEAVRRAIGRGIAAARRRRGWTQDVLAERIGASQSAISRLERGVPPLEIGELVRVARALGIAPRVELGRDPHDGPADAGHLAIQELLVRLARATAGAALVELPLGTSDRAFSVDVCVLRRRQGELILQEAWNRIGDVGAGLRSFDRKLSLAAEAAVAFPAPPSVVTGVWVVRVTRSNREPGGLPGAVRRPLHRLVPPVGPGARHRICGAPWARPRAVRHRGDPPVRVAPRVGSVSPLRRPGDPRAVVSHRPFLA